MSDEADDDSKTEEPSGKRLQEARDSGNVPMSRELISWFMLLSLALFVLAFGGSMARGLQELLTPFVTEPDRIPLDVGSFLARFESLSVDAAVYLAVPLFIAFFFALAGAVFQVGFLFSSKALEPNLEKLDPIKGLKRLFSLRSFLEFGKGILKLIIVGTALALVLWPSFDDLPKMVSEDPVTLAGEMRDAMLTLLAACLFVVGIIALVDLLYQRFDHIKKLRMTKQELKDEFKQTEGDPMVKNRLRQIRAERARKRMMAAVPTADVVVTNPTHFAVALKYDAESMTAPRCVAKGQDLVAKRIRDVAEEHKVPVIENPPLARALYATVDIDEEVPPEHYKAVAEVIGYVMRLKRETLRL